MKYEKLTAVNKNHLKRYEKWFLYLAQSILFDAQYLKYNDLLDAGRVLSKNNSSKMFQLIRSLWSLKPWGLWWPDVDPSCHQSEALGMSSIQWRARAVCLLDAQIWRSWGDSSKRSRNLLPNRFLDCETGPLTCEATPITCPSQIFPIWMD